VPVPHIVLQQKRTAALDRSRSSLFPISGAGRRPRQEGPPRCNRRAESNSGTRFYEHGVPEKVARSRFLDNASDNCMFLKVKAQRQRLRL